ncbi:hypothetical protein K7G92_002089 [Pasteurella canis]|uniref:hypothetical protein n=1 Tax=Pasteurella canis TaxID=753 RepID=UPI0006680832|nr:hypothetical protein [Pasteurella canis]MXN88091.1 hypothetical protein [Pasteurella canis]UEA16801.1 hypothetical protein K7G92_002089 [Pasteurella canis]SPY33855.1 Uncharacterised protein [Pasteurella canis]
MEQHKLKAMRAAGVGCVFMLALIAIAIFMMPTEQLIDYLTEAGRFVGGGTTFGILMLAALPPLTGAIFYYFFKWALK